MGDFMRPIEFGHVIEWALEEYKTQGMVFGVRKEKFYKNKSGKRMTNAFGDVIASPVGPAAGPQSQLLQNIVASYVAGARFMELKTVQIMDGEQIREAVNKPCILGIDEVYNCEWSTEMTVQEAYDEYLKAYFAIKVLAKELEISDGDDFAYNLSVGYDLAGIKGEKVNAYIENMKNASETPIFKECYKYLEENLDQFEHFTKEDLEKISPEVTNSITLSTLHGCPSDEIEKIATYLMTEKHMNTFVKCNPTMLGYDYARATLDKMGYDYISFPDTHFREDLQYSEAVAMITRLLPLAKEVGVSFGLKLTNTFPVDTKQGELPSEEMYMAGRTILPLAVNLAAMLSREFDGKLPIAYSGGADAFNIGDILETGIGPVTMATTLLKPGGYGRFKQIADVSEAYLKDFDGIDVAKLNKLAEDLITDERNQKRYREKIGSRKTNSELPLYDCFKAPCKEGGCPIHQQIPEYLKLVADHEYDKAMEVIAIDNTAPTITGVLCSQQCREKCTRLDYDLPLEMRSVKLIAADNAQEGLIENIKIADLRTDKKVAVIGAGPAGIAAATFLRRNGVDVVVFEKLSNPYGIVRHVIPEFRISDEAVDRDYRIAVAQGVEFKFDCDPNYDVKALKEEYAYVIVATGAWKKGVSPVKEGQDLVQDSLEFLWDARVEGKRNVGKRVAVVGAGDVAMDCARLAKRTEGVEHVAVVYRRTEAYMPASQEDVNEVRHEGITIHELVAPVSYDGKTLHCEVMTLGDYDASGRKSCVGTGEFVDMEFDTVIGATGARVDTADFERNGFNLNGRGMARLNSNLETSIEDVYIIGDCKVKPSTIVQAIADAKTAAMDILAKEGLKEDFRTETVAEDDTVILDRRGVLVDAVKAEPKEGERCLKCDQICEMCVEVCPNRANVAIRVEGFANSRQVVHIDGMCNECGNCAVFCPHGQQPIFLAGAEKEATGNPFKDKVTVFWTQEDFDLSENVGFLKKSEGSYLVRNEQGNEFYYKDGDKTLSADMAAILKALESEHAYYMTQARAQF